LLYVPNAFAHQVIAKTARLPMARLNVTGSLAVDRFDE
jgi:hypothetical protein